MGKRTNLKRSTAGWAAAFILSGIQIAAAAAPVEELRLVEHASNEATAHIGPGPDNPGDILSFANEIFDAANKTKLGTDQGYCVRVTPSKAYECLWTVTLAKGQIMVQGPYFDAGDSVLAITGGTGAYAGAGGEMALHARDAKGSEYDFVYRIRRGR
jgi:hypothetical protein